MAGLRHSSIDSPSTEVSFPRRPQAMPSHAGPRLPIERKRSYRRRNGQSGVLVAPTLDPVHPTTSSIARATAAHLAAFLLSEATPSHLPSFRPAGSAESI